MTAPNTNVIPGLITPDVGNIMVGKGFCIFKPDGETNYFHLGNIPKLSITPKVDLLKHYSSQTGTKKRDLIVVNTQEMECVMDLEEASANNMRLMFSGSVDWATPVAPVVTLMSLTQITGHLKYYASNDVGPRWYIDLPSVTFYPSGEFGAISDGFNSMQVTGTVNFANGVWGTATLAPPNGSIAPENLLAPFIDLGGDAAPVHGETYRVILGGWTGAVSYTYLWKAGGTAGAGSPNNAATYTPAVADETKALTCDVIATNAAGTTTVTTAATPVVV